MTVLRRICWLLGLVCCSLQAATPLEPTTDRLPRTNLLVFHSFQGAVVSVQSRKDWEKRREEILRGLQAVMRPLPGKEKVCPLEPRVQEERDEGSYLQRLMTYASEPGSRVPAYLLVPKAVLQAKHQAPAVLVLHPTDPQYGHRVVVEQLRANYRAFARDLAERGFVVLAPAYPLMANYQPDLKALGYQSGTMKAIWDNRRGVDLLESLPFVKRGRFGALGHSLGGHNALFTAAFDDRIRVVVSSCGFDSFQAYYGGKPENWELGRGWCQERYMPKLAAYRGRLEDIPFDFHELLGVLAPRPVFINAPLGDANFQWRSVDEIVAAARPVYELYQAGSNLRVEHPPGGHDFPPEQREEAYRFLEKYLR